MAAPLASQAAGNGPLHQRATWVEPLTPEEREVLRSDGYVERSPGRARGLGLLPTGAVRDEIYSAAREIDPNIVSERMIFVDSEATPEAVLNLFNLFYRPGELAFLRYYNERKDTTHDLFRECFRVDGPRSRNPLPDTEVNAIPRRDAIWTVQGLPPFGPTLQDVRVRRLQLANGRSGFVTTIVNQDDLRYRDIEVLQEKKMITAFVVVPGDGFLVLYALGAARVRPIFALLGRERIESSFSGRNTGLFDYLDQTYLEPLRP